MQGINIVGVQFRRAGKIYDFSSGEIELAVGDHVIVDSERGPSLAQVVAIRFHNPVERLEKKLKPILRKASSKELSKPARLDSDEVSDFTAKQVGKLKLNMRVLKSEVQFGGNKVIVYFTAPGRVDFRELVKDLAGGLRTRVELKQVGARDETKLLGGMGICGREYCCSSFLREFVPVSIRMAKNQNLALNPSKVSGGCGRLLCCLTYENDTYTHLRQVLPPRGTLVESLSLGISGRVIKSDLLNQLVVLEDASGQPVSCKVSDLKILDKQQASYEESGDEELTDLEDAADEWAESLDLESLTKHLEDKPAAAKGQQRGGGPRNQGDGQRSQRADGERGQRPSRGSDGQRPNRPEGQRGSRPQRGPRPDGERQQRSNRPEGQGSQRADGDRGQRQPRPDGERRPHRGEGQRGNRPDGDQGPREQQGSEGAERGGRPPRGPQGQGQGQGQGRGRQRDRRGKNFNSPRGEQGQGQGNQQRDRSQRQAPNQDEGTPKPAKPAEPPKE